MVVFHGSPVAGIKIFTPRISTHGKPVIYASDRMDAVLLYCAKWNDFMLTCGSEEVVVERYKGAFDELYKEKKGYIYILDGTTFQFDEYCNELVSEKTVEVIDCITINNLYEVVMAKYTVYLYPDKPQWITDDDGDIVEHAIEIYKMSGDFGIFNYIYERYPKLDKQIKNAMIDIIK